MSQIWIFNVPFTLSTYNVKKLCIFRTQTIFEYSFDKLHGISVKAQVWCFIGRLDDAVMVKLINLECLTWLDFPVLLFSHEFHMCVVNTKLTSVHGQKEPSVGHVVAVVTLVHFVTDWQSVMDKLGIQRNDLMLNFILFTKDKQTLKGKRSTWTVILIKLQRN